MANLDRIGCSARYFNTFNEGKCFGVESRANGFRTFSVFSYETLIAFGVFDQNAGEEVWLVNTGKYSKTTSKHRNALINGVGANNVKHTFENEDALKTAQANFLPYILGSTLEDGKQRKAQVKI